MSAKAVDRFLSTREVVTRTSLSRTTLWELVKRGDFPGPVQITPGRVGYRESAVAAWMDARPASAPSLAS